MNKLEEKMVHAIAKVRKFQREIVVSSILSKNNRKISPYF
jgi:hypothetical protein